MQSRNADALRTAAGTRFRLQHEVEAFLQDENIDWRTFSCWWGLRIAAITLSDGFHPPHTAGATQRDTNQHRRLVNTLNNWNVPHFSDYQWGPHRGDALNLQSFLRTPFRHLPSQPIMVWIFLPEVDLWQQIGRHRGIHHRERFLITGGPYGKGGNDGRSVLMAAVRHAQIAD